MEADNRHYICLWFNLVSLSLHEIQSLHSPLFANADLSRQDKGRLIALYILATEPYIMLKTPTVS